MNENGNEKLNNSVETPDDELIVRKRAKFDEGSLKEIDNPYQSSAPGEAPKAEEHKPDTAQAESEKTEAEKTEPDKKSKKKKSVLAIIVLVIALIAFAVSALIIVRNIYLSKKNQQQSQALAESINGAEDDDTVGPDGIFEKYRALYNQNQDFVGWIRIPGTSVNHPVVKAADNDFYLHRGLDKKYDVRGTVFMDYRDHIDELCKNTILYGHNNLDSTMFSDLEKYKNVEFYKQSPIIEFNTIYKNYKWKIIAVYYTNADDKDDNGYALNYIYPFMTDDSFNTYIIEMMERTLYFTGVDVNKYDKILTLSTCTRDMDIRGRGETNARFVVIGRLVREGESADVDVSQVTLNDNPRYPQIWYDIHNQPNPYASYERWYPEGVEY